MTIVCALVSMACKKRQASSSVAADAVFADSRLESEFDTGRAQLQKDMEKDRAELVRAAPDRFLPETTKKRVALRLFVKDSEISRGRPLRYRAELQNVGAEPVTFVDSSGFFKLGTLGGDFHCFLKPDGGNAKDVSSRLEAVKMQSEVKFSKSATGLEKDDAVKELSENARRQSRLFVELKPGETVLTRGENGDQFRSLPIEESPSPGPHTFWCELHDEPLSKPDNKLVEGMAAKGISREQFEHDLQTVNAQRLGLVKSSVIRVTVSKK